MWMLKSWKGIVISFILIVFIIASLFWLYLNVQASMSVTAQNSKIQLPESLPVKIEVGNYLETMSQGKLDTQINLDRKVNIPLKGKYLANLKFNVTVPVKVRVDYKTKIKIDQVMPLETTSALVFPQSYMPKLPLKIDIPIKMDVPFEIHRDYVVPIQIAFNGPVYLDLNERIDLAVKHQLNPTLKINDRITMRKIAAFDATMYNTVQHSKADLKLDMTLPLKNIHP
ncbi:hypothetical protein G9F31_13545 [Acinetobacter sp. 187]|nr:hypothetical protein [Acinetobacter lanii]